MIEQEVNGWADARAFLLERFEDVRDEVGSRPRAGWTAACPVCHPDNRKRFFIDREYRIEPCAQGHGSDEILTASDLARRAEIGDDDDDPSVVEAASNGYTGRVEGAAGATTTRRADEWPTLDAKAYYGLAGEFVRVVEPHSEADPVALLLHLLVAFGSVIGHSAHFIVEGTRHYLNLFAVLVGQSSRGRKGTAWGRTIEMFPTSSADWKDKRIQSGLSSGEGLIWAVRDSVERTVRGKPVVEEGVDDKRLLVLEPEFATVLRVIEREGNTLSPTIREAWDSGDLRILTKNSPAVATNAHISIVGHITQDELRRCLHNTEVGNGFGNRFLWACVRRSKSLPFGGALDSTALEPLRGRMERTIAFASATGEMAMDAEARALWQEVYPELTAGRPGLVDSLTTRAEAQARRLACIFALLELASVVGRPHLEAALEIVRYVEASVDYIFGDALGDPDADALLRALRNAPNGLSRTEIRDLFGRNRSVGEIDRALAVLLDANLARPEIVETGGRPAERWHAVNQYPSRCTTETTLTTEASGVTP